jgi:pilus assembly protein CpaE
MAAPFNTLSTMVLSHSSEEGVSAEAKVAASAKSLVDNLKSMLTKPKAQAA